MPNVRPTQHGDAVFPGDGYPPLGLFSLPFADRLLGAFWFGSGPDIASTDWSGNDADIAFTGTPDFSQGYGKFSGQNFGVTGVAETLAATVLAVFRETTDTRTAIYGNFGGVTAVGLSLYVQNDSTTVHLNTGREGNTSGVAMIGSNTAEWSMISAQVPETGQARVKNHVTGNSNTGGSSLDRITNGIGPMRIGQFESGSFVGESDILAILHYDGAMTNAEVDAVALELRAMAAAVGVTV